MRHADLQVELVDYGMNSVSQGIDAIAITRVVIRPTGQNVQPGITPQVSCPAIGYDAVYCACSVQLLFQWVIR